MNTKIEIEIPTLHSQKISNSVIVITFKDENGLLCATGLLLFLLISSSIRDASTGSDDIEMTVYFAHLFMSDDVSPHSSHFIVVRPFFET